MSSYSAGFGTVSYDGVAVRGDRLQALAKTTRWSMPCHRSHIDYLLLSYVVYRAGPLCRGHIAVAPV